MEAHVQPVKYQINLLTEEDSVDWWIWNLYVEWRGKGRWAVTDGHRVLNDQNEWDHEGSDDRSDDTWLATHRFGLHEALDKAKRMVHRVKVNGMTAADVRLKHWPPGRPGKPPGWT
jgi:hypothetical protein